MVNRQPIWLQHQTEEEIQAQGLIPQIEEMGTTETITQEEDVERTTVIPAITVIAGDAAGTAEEDAGETAMEGMTRRKLTTTPIQIIHYWMGIRGEEEQTREERRPWKQPGGLTST